MKGRDPSGEKDPQLHVQLEAEIRSCTYKLRNAKRLPATPRSQEATRKDFAVKPFSGSMALLTPSIQISSLRNCQRINFYFKAGNMWYFVTAAP